LALGPAILDHDIFALDIAGVLETLAKCAQTIRKPIRRCAVEEPDHRHCRWLRPRGGCGWSRHTILAGDRYLHLPRGDFQRIRTKQRRVRFGVGALAYLLKNRIYIGEVVYRGEVHRGEHEPILDRDVFEAAQVKLAAGTVERRLRLKASPAVLTGRIFDDRGNRMSPTHSNKLGARYRYYASHAVIAKRKEDAGSVARVPAPEIETLVLKAVREHLRATNNAEHAIIAAHHDLIERHVGRIVVKPNMIEVQLVEDEPTTLGDQNHGMGEDSSDPRPLTLALPWAPQIFSAVKGVLHTPDPSPSLKSELRDGLLTAIGKARGWVEDLLGNRVTSFAEIAANEGKTERYIRLLASLAFISPRIVSVLIDGTAPADLTVAGLAKLPDSWAEQERQFGLPCA
jgi:site-specific DNA recombinase